MVSLASLAMQENSSLTIYFQVPANIALARNFLSPLYGIELSDRARGNPYDGIQRNTTCTPSEEGEDNGGNVCTFVRCDVTPRKER